MLYMLYCIVKGSLYTTCVPITSNACTTMWPAAAHRRAHPENNIICMRLVYTKKGECPSLGNLMNQRKSFQDSLVITLKMHCGLCDGRCDSGDGGLCTHSLDVWIHISQHPVVPLILMPSVILFNGRKWSNKAFLLLGQRFSALVS